MANRPKSSKAIFVAQNGSPLNYFSIQAYWRRRLRKLGIGPDNLRQRKGRTGKSPHEFRDLFRSQWAKSSAKPEVGEFCMGHMIDPLEYNKAWRDEKFYRDEYSKALPYLQIMSSGKPYHMVGEDEVDALRQEVERLQSGRDERIRQLEEKIEKITEVRSESDDVMNRLFEDPEFREVLTKKLKEIQL